MSVTVCVPPDAVGTALFAQCGSQVNWTAAGQLEGLLYPAELHQTI